MEPLSSEMGSVVLACSHIWMDYVYSMALASFLSTFSPSLFSQPTLVNPPSGPVQAHTMEDSSRSIWIEGVKWWMEWRRERGHALVARADHILSSQSTTRVVWWNDHWDQWDRDGQEGKDYLSLLPENDEEMDEMMDGEEEIHTWSSCWISCMDCGGEDFVRRRSTTLLLR